MNQPTAQFYRVALDNDFPYHVYGAQQDNSTVRIASRTAGGGITRAGLVRRGRRRERLDRARSARFRNRLRRLLRGLITRQDHRTGQIRDINAWPDNPMGYGAEAMKYRFQWSFPIVFSPHDPKTLYIARERVDQDHQRGPELGSDQPRPDAQR